jgi:hypothetical protein
MPAFILNALGLKKKPIGATTPVTPAPSDAGTIAAPPMPPTQASQASGIAKAGLGAGLRQRLAMTPAKNNGLAPSIIPAPKPVLRPQTIAGGY